MEPYDDVSPLLTAGDTRQQIIANALVQYPNIVEDHIKSFPGSPVRATDIFDVCVANVTKQYGSEDARKFIARLSYAHKKCPAARMLIASGWVMPTMELALPNLLEQSAKQLGDALDILLPLREGCVEAADERHPGWGVHEIDAQMGLAFAEIERDHAAATDRVDNPNPTTATET